MEARPPDPHENDPPPIPNHSTEIFINPQHTDAAVLNQSVTGTVHSITQKTPPPEIPTSDQNCPNLNRPKPSSSSKTSPHQVSAQTTIPISSSDQFQISGELRHTGNGHPPTRQNANINSSNTPKDQFPPLTSNFDPPNSVHRLNSLNPPTVRPNVSPNSNPNANPSTANNVQQLNLKALQARFDNQANQQYTHANVSAKANNAPLPAPLPPSVFPNYATRLRADQHNTGTKIDISSPIITTKQGLPAVLFKREDFMVKLAENCKYTLIGKFASTMPKMEAIRRSLTSQLQIRGTCKVTHFNATHVYIDLDNAFDHATLWNKEKLYIEGRIMRLLVWTPTFTPQEETTIAPVWVVLPALPWHCYRMEFVTKLLEPIGRVLFFDAASIQKTRGSVAKVKVEIDITKPRPNHVWLGFPQQEDDVYGDGRWQELQFENIPEYCYHCKHQGHSIQNCKIKARDDEYQRRKQVQQEVGKGHEQVMDKNSNQKSFDPKNLTTAQQGKDNPNVKSQSTNGHASQQTQPEKQQNDQWQVQKRKVHQGPNRNQLYPNQIKYQPKSKSANQQANQPLGAVEKGMVGLANGIEQMVVPEEDTDQDVPSKARIPVQKQQDIAKLSLSTENSFDVLKESEVEEHCAIDENASQPVEPFGKSAAGSNQLPSGVCQRVLLNRAQVAGTEVKDTGSVQKDDTVEEMENAVTVYDAVPLLVVEPPPVTGATGQVVDALPHAAETTKNWVNCAFGKIGLATKWDEEHPKSECAHNIKPLSIHDKLKQYAGYEHEPDVFFLGDMFNESLEGNTLTPTLQLEFMCNEASKVIKVAGHSNWNLNAQPFTPNAFPPQGIVVATEKAEPNDVATESGPVQPKRVQPSRSSRSKPYRGKG